MLNLPLPKKPLRLLRRLPLTLMATSSKFCTNPVIRKSSQSNTRILLPKSSTEASMLSRSTPNSLQIRERTKVVSTKTPKRQRPTRQRKQRKSQLLLLLMLLLKKKQRRKSKFFLELFNEITDAFIVCE